MKNNLQIVDLGSIRSHRHDLSDRTRFEAVNGSWASLGFPNSHNAEYRVFTHKRPSPCKLICKRFLHLADALDYLADWLRKNDCEA